MFYKHSLKKYMHVKEWVKNKYLKIPTLSNPNPKQYFIIINPPGTLYSSCWAHYNPHVYEWLYLHTCLLYYTLYTTTAALLAHVKAPTITNRLQALNIYACMLPQI